MSCVNRLFTVCRVFFCQYASPSSAHGGHCFPRSVAGSAAVGNSRRESVRAGQVGIGPLRPPGPQRMAAGHPLPAADHSLRAAEHPLPAAGHPQRAADPPLPAVDRPLRAADHPLPAGDHPLRAADRPLKAGSAPQRPASGTINGRAVSRRAALLTRKDRTAENAENAE